MKNTKKTIKLVLNNTLDNVKILIRHYRRLALMIILMLVITLQGMSPNLVISPLQLRTEYYKNTKEKINEKIIDEVNKYIIENAKNSKLDSKTLVNVCHEYKLDIVFVLAQGLLESHFGTKGVASKTNSVFNVGTYDNGKILYTYKNPNESIEPYAILLTKNYLINTSLSNLLKDKGYVNKYGNRFASATSYEDRLRSLMVKIKLETSIGSLQRIYDMDSNEFDSLFQVTQFLN